MLITTATPTAYLLRVLSPEQVRHVADNVPAQPLPQPLLAYSVGEWLRLTADAQRAVDHFLAEPLAYLAFGRLRSWREQNTRLAESLKRYELPTTDDERQASVGVPWPTPEERALSLLIRYYHLRSVREAESLTVADYLTAYRDTMAEAIYQRKLTNIQANKHGKR